MKQMKVGDYVICHYRNGGTTKGEILSLPGKNPYYVILYFTYDSNGYRHEGWFFEEQIELDKQYYRKLKLEKLK